MIDMSGEWRPDPGGQFDYRWWDGNGWTDQVSKGGEVQTAPLPAQGGQAPPPPPPVQTGGDPRAGLKGELLDGTFAEHEDPKPVQKQNGKLLRCHLGEPVLARRGAMVAYQGNMNFEAVSSGGIGSKLKAAAGNEGVPLMRITGQGDIFFADLAGDVHILELDGGALSVNGRHVLAFSSSLHYDIQAISTGGSGGGVNQLKAIAAGVLAGGLFNTVLSGTGWVAITTEGSPVVLDTGGAPTFVDKDALVAWSANLSLSLNRSSAGLSSYLRGGSGEALQVAFTGDGFCIVQPSEGQYVPAQDGSNQASSGGGALGKLLGG